MTAVVADDADVDEEFRALLEGLRTSLPGVQVLFAFLLTAPLQSSFGDLVDRQRVVFSLAFLASALASVLLIAPSVHQRFRAPYTGMRRHSRNHLVTATWLAIAGTALMAVAVVATTYLVADLVFDNTVAVLSACALSVVLTWSWIYLPMVHFRRNG